MEKVNALIQMRSNAAAIFNAGVAAVAPRSAIRRFCRRDGEVLQISAHRYDLSAFEAVYVVGAGKAGAAMAAALEEIIGDRITDGVVVVKYGHLEETQRIRILEAGHPVPDENSASGASAVIEMAKRAGEKDLVICLISGGGSALLALPSAGICLEDKKATNRVLLECGAAIHEINAIRKHLSDIKGGRLAEAVHPARLATLIISDVIGDDLDVIASGPTVPDRSTFSQCIEIVNKYLIEKRLPAMVLKHLKAGAAGRVPENPKSDHPAFRHHFPVVIAGNADALRSAGEKAESLGYHCLMLSSMIEGETRHVARVHAAIAREIRLSGNPLAPPACVLTGGETTVTISGSGKGGRNQEFALAAALDLHRVPDVVVLSAGTDGSDGPTDAAGAFADTLTVQRAAEQFLDAGSYLDNNDAYHFFQELGDLFITGPTNTNVMDIRIVLVGA